MTQKSITIKASLDARQAAYFVLNMQEGQTALITADGKDEAAAVEELAAVLA